MSLSDADVSKCTDLLSKSVLLRNCSGPQRTAVCRQAEKKTYKHGDVLVAEGSPQERMFVIAEGTITREKKDVEGTVHNIDTQLCGSTCGSLHALNRDPCFATARCATDVTTYEIKHDTVKGMFKTDADFAWNVTYGLSLQIRNFTKAQRTPLLEQHAKPLPFAAVSIAAGVESFYRAALNAFMNQQLTGVPMGSLFPNMHVQMPVRIIYINGLKGLRAYLDREVQPDKFQSPILARVAVAITPGLAMSPFSSLLEASNAGHSNPEPLMRRWMRGFVPRCVREVIFGIGLNQLSEWCEERVPDAVQSPAARNAIGSLTAGVVSGYFSHVAHNLSTLKLMNPAKTYGQHFTEYVKRSEGRVQWASGVLRPSALRALTLGAALFTPMGCIIRTSQIVGSFIILNGSIDLINRYGHKVPLLSAVLLKKPPSSQPPQ